MAQYVRISVNIDFISPTPTNAKKTQSISLCAVPLSMGRVREREKQTLAHNSL